MIPQGGTYSILNKLILIISKAAEVNKFTVIEKADYTQILKKEEGGGGKAARGFQFCNVALLSRHKITAPRGKRNIIGLKLWGRFGFKQIKGKTHPIPKPRRLLRIPRCLDLMPIPSSASQKV